MTLPPLSFDTFEAAPPATYDGDPIWRVRMFRMAAYLSGRCRSDAAALGARVSLRQADQLTQAVGSIAANLAEGYSRVGRADQARFYTYALGSTREALTWVDTLAVDGWPPRAEYRDLLIQIRRQLLTAIKRMRLTRYEPPPARPGRPRRRES